MKMILASLAISTLLGVCSASGQNSGLQLQMYVRVGDAGGPFPCTEDGTADGAASGRTCCADNDLGNVALDDFGSCHAYIGQQRGIQLVNASSTGGVESVELAHWTKPNCTGFASYYTSTVNTCFEGYSNTYWKVTAGGSGSNGAAASLRGGYVALALVTLTAAMLY